MLCPQCQKDLPNDTAQCPRCQSDLSLLSSVTNSIELKRKAAEDAVKAGDLGGAVLAYLRILDASPSDADALKRLAWLPDAVRFTRFDRHRRFGRRIWFLFGLAMFCFGWLMASLFLAR